MKKIRVLIVLFSLLLTVTGGHVLADPSLGSGQGNPSAHR
jgi:hypothetical protein